MRGPRRTAQLLGRSVIIVGGMNHFAAVCRKKGVVCATQVKAAVPRAIHVGESVHVADAVHVGDQVQVGWSNQQEVLRVGDGGQGHDPPLCVTVSVNGVVVVMKVDTGASISMIPHSVFRKHFQNAKLSKCHLKLCSFTGEEVPVEGIFKAKVQYKDQSALLDLYVVCDSNHTLLGRDWLRALRLDWKEVMAGVGPKKVCVSAVTGKSFGEDGKPIPGTGSDVARGKYVEEVVAKHRVLFDGSLGLLKGSRL